MHVNAPTMFICSDRVIMISTSSAATIYIQLSKKKITLSCFFFTENVDGCSLQWFLQKTDRCYFFRLKHKLMENEEKIQANHIAEMTWNNMIQHGFVVHPGMVAVDPLLRSHVDDGHGATGPLFLIGYFREKPVYRTTHTVAHCENEIIFLWKDWMTNMLFV